MVPIVLAILEVRQEDHLSSGDQGQPEQYSVRHRRCPSKCYLVVLKKKSNKMTQ